MCIKSQETRQAEIVRVPVSSKAIAFLRKDKKEQNVLIYRSNGTDFSLKPTAQETDYLLPNTASGRIFAVKTAFGQTVYGSICKLGNAKLWHTVMILDLAAGKIFFCPLDCRGCYAANQQKFYPTVFNHRIINSWIAQSNPELLFEYVDKCLSMYGPKQFRIHSSGEIPNLRYVLALCKLAQKWKGTISFYMYTKKPEYIKYLECAGINVVRSSVIDKNGKIWINYGKQEYINEFLKHFPEYVLCPAIDKDGTVLKEEITLANGKIKVRHKVQCGRNCDLCITHKYVAFYYHDSNQKKQKKNKLITIEKPKLITSINPPLVV